ncbi:uncharacterized protein [Penaeus vannamei]|uniref:uncharacterized protein n=1 Tax=Penaeus vannamei TaxID=6689 RepID=UPI00387F5465
MVIDTIFKSSSPLLPTQSVESAVEEGPLLLVCEMASFALRSCFVLAALLMASFVCGLGPVGPKPGRCPTPISSNLPPCAHDLNCPGDQKCCRTTLSASNPRVCISPNFG